MDNSISEAAEILTDPDFFEPLSILRHREPVSLPVSLKRITFAAYLLEYLASILKTTISISVTRMKANASYNIVEQCPIAAGLSIIKDQIFFYRQAVQDGIYRRLSLAGLFGTSRDRDSRRETG